MSYQYEVFFSYKRDTQSDAWHYEVKEKLRYWLSQELKQLTVQIFFDTEEIKTGQRWPRRLADALRHSKCIVCIWSPLYFQSKWCVSEWKTFVERENLCQTDLVLPATYHDGESFPPEAQAKQMADFSDYTSTMPSFWKTERAVDFEPLLRKFARDVADLIRRAPKYDDTFPVVEARDDQVKEESVIERPANG